jgi:rare lipoprotein A
MRFPWGCLQMRLPARLASTIAPLLLLNACAANDVAEAERPLATGPGPAMDIPVVTGPAFTIEGVTYAPADTFNYDAVGYASTGDEAGDGISAAHKTLPLPSYAEVTSLENGRTVLVRVARRGPMTNDRLIELSPAAVAQLGLAGQERPAVRVRRVNPPEPERALLRSGQPAPERMNTPRPLLDALLRKLDDQTPVPVPAAEATPTNSAEPVSTAASVAQLPQSAFLVQAGAFSVRQRADAVATSVGGRVEAVDRIYRVRMGPFSSRSEAEAALARARAAGYSEARILRAE